MQAAGRRVAYHTFSHVLELDLAFHLERRTGTLTRILERGGAMSVRSGLMMSDAVSIQAGCLIIALQPPAHAAPGH